MDKKISFFIFFAAILTSLILFNLINLKISLALIVNTKVNDISENSKIQNFNNDTENISEFEISMIKEDAISVQPTNNQQFIIAIEPTNEKNNEIITIDSLDSNHFTKSIEEIIINSPSDKPIMPRLISHNLSNEIYNKEFPKNKYIFIFK
jgi:hypothetical protein